MYTYINIIYSYVYMYVYIFVMFKYIHCGASKGLQHVNSTNLFCHEHVSTMLDGRAASYRLFLLGRQHALLTREEFLFFSLRFSRSPQISMPGTHTDTAAFAGEFVTSIDTLLPQPFRSSTLLCTFGKRQKY